MLQHKYRLRRSSDLERVRQEGDVWRHPFIVFLACKNEQDDESRFAFVASRRVGNAVQRNRVRRLMREAIRQHLDEICPEWDCILIARPQILQATFAEVETAVLQLLRRAKLLRVIKRTEDQQHNQLT